ncbi:hypothetical protein GKZ75_09605 [Kocuria indica]|uniref:Holin n=1 Tax=Kocuria marina subsp. indica TaxID=1049583 RepID=A0A6N9QYY4_9MICC|nr:hypothetical protein [Kocuria indica]NDO78472.1 hypothetical protein [Kocuria indica]
MAAQAVTEPTGKKIGSTTVGATAGTGLAGAAAVVLVWILGEAGVDVPTEVAAALAVLIGGIGTLIGGKLVPSNQVRTETQIVPVAEGSVMEKNAAAGIPDGTGEHRAEPAGSTVADDPDSDLVVTDTTVRVP